MEYLILNSYLKLKKETKKSLVEFIITMPRLYQVLFAALFLSSICAFVFVFVNIKSAYLITAISMLIEFVSVISISISVQREGIEKSKESIERLDNQYKEIKIWLIDMGFIEKNQIKQLCNRCRTVIEHNKEGNSRRKEFIDKVFKLFLIPIYVSIVSLILGLEGNISDRITIVVGIGIIGTVLYIGIFGIIEFITPFIDNTYIKMGSMVREIQGMLDREFPICEDDIK